MSYGTLAVSKGGSNTDRGSKRRVQYDNKKIIKIDLLLTLNQK